MRERGDGPGQRGGSIAGVVGSIKWAYHWAAAIEGYTVTRSPDNVWTLKATVTACDPFKLSQAPLVFVAPHARGAWIWPVDALDLHDGRLTARLGAPIA